MAEDILEIEQEELSDDIQGVESTDGGELYEHFR